MNSLYVELWENQPKGQEEGLSKSEWIYYSKLRHEYITNIDIDHINELIKTSENKITRIKYRKVKEVCELFKKYNRFMQTPICYDYYFQKLGPK